jgi:hypothetical protein
MVIFFLLMLIDEKFLYVGCKFSVRISVGSVTEKKALTWLDDGIGSKTEHLYL